MIFSNRKLDSHAMATTHEAHPDSPHPDRGTSPNPSPDIKPSTKIIELSSLSSASFHAINTERIDTTMPKELLDTYYRSNYQEARMSFLAAAKKEGAKLSKHIPASLVDHEPELAIDIAEFGPDDADRVLFHISGTHGVEGYTGSAIQTAILDHGVEIPENTKVIFIHALNPYGMAYNRRVNESNVDINRNCFRNDAKRSGAPEYYEKIDPVINPTSPPGWFNAFYIKAALSILRYGFDALKQAVAGGQYEYPKGLYYGGAKREDSVSFLEEFAQEKMGTAKELMVIDIHSGLGPYADEMLMVDYESPSDLDDLCRNYFKTEPFRSEKTGVAYEASGQLSQGVAALLDKPVYWFTQEFGTYHPVMVANALRQENRYHQYGEGNPEHPSKEKLVHTFNPKDSVWRKKVVARGMELFSMALEALKRTE